MRQGRRRKGRRVEQSEGSLSADQHGRRGGITSCSGYVWVFYHREMQRQVEGGGKLRRDTGNAFAGFLLFMFGSDFFGVYFLSIAVILVVSLRYRVQNALISASINMRMCRRWPAFKLFVEEAYLFYVLTTSVTTLCYFFRHTMTVSFLVILALQSCNKCFSSYHALIPLTSLAISTPADV